MLQNARRIYNKTCSAKLYKEDQLNSSKLIVLRPGTIWLHFTQLKNSLTEKTLVWSFTESELNKCLCHSPLYRSELLLNLFPLFLRYLLACFVVVDDAEKKILVTFAIFANFAGFQMTFFTFPFKKSELFLNLLFFLFWWYLLAFNVVFAITTKN